MRRLPVVGILLALAACGSPGTPGTPGTPAVSPQQPTWGACEEIDAAANFQCATLSVPLDYAKPAGAKIGIAMVRLPATGSAGRLGSLVLNFGGPGGSGVGTLISAAGAFPVLGARYDLVSFDPRGVDRSAGVKCLDDKAFEAWLATQPSLDVMTETRLDTQFAQACQRNSGPVLPYIGTVNAARDMDAMRAWLNEPKLTFLGFSYGTHLGAVYATMFPQRSGRMVLDSAVDPSIGTLEMNRTQILGFQKAYEEYLADCAANGCPFDGDPAVLGLLETLTKEPLKVDGRLVTADTARAAIAEALYSRLTWPLLTQSISDAVKGDGSGLLTLADSYDGRRPDGTYTSLQASLRAITCADTTDRPSVEEAEALARDLMKKSPIFGLEAAGAGSCSVWPVPGENSNKRIDATGSEPIVVVGVTNDPATPYQWAPRLAEQLRTGVLVTLKGEGHGAYGQSTCVDAVVDNYLINGKAPENGTVC